MLKCITSNCSCAKCAKLVREENSLIKGLPNYLVVCSIFPKVVDEEWSDAMYEVMNDLRSVNKMWMHVMDNNEGWISW